MIKNIVVASNYVILNKKTMPKTKRKRPVNCKSNVADQIVKHEIKIEENDLSDAIFEDRNTKGQYSCEYCSKNFQRKAAKIHHEKNCESNQVTREISLESNLKHTKRDPIYKRCIENDRNNTNCEEKIAEKPKNETRITEKNVDESIYDFDDDTEDPKKPNKDRFCTMCKAEFETPLELLKHRREAHTYPKIQLPVTEIEKYANLPKRDECPLCGKPLKIGGCKSMYLKHLMTHATGLYFECSICERKFKRRDHMNSHKKRHIV